MTDLSSPLTYKNKFLIFGGGFSGDYFAKTIRKLGCKALSSSRSISNDPHGFIFNSENNSLPEDSIFEGVTHVLSCIPPDKHGNCLLYTSPSPRDATLSRMPSSA